jgi:protein-S-isoprenylcysteine O-methyltransferase Ste14
MNPIVRPVADAAMVACLLLGSAGTLHWWRAWVLSAVLLVVRTITAIAVYRTSPALLRERARLPVHHDQPWIDRIILLAVLSTGYVALPIIAARDVFSWHLLPRPGLPIADAGLALFVLGWTLKGIALRQNAFAITVVRVQRERRHAVVDEGVYGFVRHPFYAGTPLVLVGMALWLESLSAAIYATAPIAIMLIRIGLEERLLRRELAGYAEYAARVRYRLVPGIW